MPEKYEIITVSVRQNASGLLIATSDALDGVYIAHREIGKIVEDMPRIVQRWFKVHKGVDVKVFVGSPEKLDGDFTFPFIPVPVEIAAQALAR